jgi:hypothetical protein
MLMPLVTVIIGKVKILPAPREFSVSALMKVGNKK